MPCPHFWCASATRSISARKLLWALLDRIMSRPKPGRALSSRLRRFRLGAHRRRGRRDDWPFVPSPQQRAPLGELPPKRRSPPDAALRPARPASRGKRERESDPSWCHASQATANSCITAMTRSSTRGSWQIASLPDQGFRVLEHPPMRTGHGRRPPPRAHQQVVADQHQPDER